MVIFDFVMKKHDIKILSHAWTPYLGRRRIKVISWIPDFQYLHLPAMFPYLNFEKECEYNRKIATLADATIVSSEHALGDLLSLIPRCAQPPIEVLRFVSQPFTALNQELPQLDSLEVKYGFKGNFFLLPNQFWAHKNHEVVLRALAIIKSTGQSMTVLMTGNTRDYRLEGTPYIDSLMSTIKDLEIHEEARILGLIDYNDLLSLMRHCVGFINPSRFEGWSSSVEEAKSVGKAILMSRIPVHVEQAPNHGAYFECDDANKLAELMLELWAKHDPSEQAAQMQAARSDLHRRTEAFGLQYLRLVHRVLVKSA
jgi:glycosyltransferase involved in cell wall biosynthesis